MIKGFIALLVMSLTLVSFAYAEPPVELLARFNAYPHAVIVNQSDASVVDHEIGLGAMQKVRGAWRFKTSERLTVDWCVIPGKLPTALALARCWQRSKRP